MRLCWAIGSALLALARWPLLPWRTRRLRASSRRTPSTRAPGRRPSTRPATASTGAVVGAAWATGALRRRALVRRHRRLRRPARPRHLLQQRGFTLEAWVQKATDEERRRGRRHLDRQRADALGRPPRVALPPHARRQLLDLSRLRPQPASSGSGSTSPRRSTARPPATTSTAPRSRAARSRAASAARTPGGSAPTAVGPGGFFDGLIDEVRVYDRALSAAEIVADRRPAARDRRPRRADDARGTSPSRRRTQTSVSLAWTRFDRRRRRRRLHGLRRRRRRRARRRRRRSRYRGSTCSTSYELEVEAFDGAGNASPRALVDGVDDAPATATPGLVAAYAFDEGSGPHCVRRVGQRAQRHDLGRDLGGRPPRRRRSRFDGADDHVGLGSLGTFYTAAFTLEAWVQKSTAKKDVARGRHLDGQRPDALGRPRSPAATTSRSARASRRTSTRARAPQSATWQHLAATFDGTTARYYVDGAQVATRAVSGSVGSSNTWRIGAYGAAPGGFFDGLVDDVRIYNRALTAGRDPVRPRPRGHATRHCRPTRHRRARPEPSPRRPASARSDAELGCGERQRRRDALQRPPLDEPGFTPSAANRIAQPTATTYTDTGLAPGVYYYRVTAEDAEGNVGPASNEATATVADTTPPSAPGTLTATGGSGQASLSWGAADRQRRRRAVQRPPLDDLGLHAVRGEPGRAADRPELHGHRRSPGHATTTWSPRRTPPATSGPPRTRRAPSSPPTRRRPTVSITAPTGGRNGVRDHDRQRQRRRQRARWRASSSGSTA